MAKGGTMDKRLDELRDELRRACWDRYVVESLATVNSLQFVGPEQARVHMRRAQLACELWRLCDAAIETPASVVGG